MAGAHTIVEILMVRKAAADVMVRYLGGDPSLVEEVAANRLRQEDMDDDDPARLFGQTMESEARRGSARRSPCWSWKAGRSAPECRLPPTWRASLGALQDLGLPVSDRDRMLAKDMITSAAFTQAGQLEGEGGGATRTYACSSSARAGARRGRRRPWGKKPRRCTWRTFPKKTIFARGQMVEASRWTASMAEYLERALQAL